MTHLPSLPSGTLIDVFARRPERYAALHAFGEAVMRGPSPFSAGERELMAAYVSRLNGCHFCEAAHSAAAEHFGEDISIVASLVENMEVDLPKERLRPVFRYLRQLTLSPAGVGPGLVDEFLGAGWGEEAIESANLVCGFFSLMNRLVEGLGLDADRQTIAMAGKQLHDHGYESIGPMARAMARSA